jgi:hypothetical protein
VDELSDPRVGFLCSDVERFCGELDELAPAIRLGLLEELRLALAGVVDEARPGHLLAITRHAVWQAISTSYST